VLSAAEIARGVAGAFAFLRRDPQALQCYDNTMEACLRSFRVMVLALPFHVVLNLIRYAHLTVQVDVFDIVMVEAISYVVNWLLFPVIFYEIARRRGWLERYPRYIGALNWISLPATIVATAAVAVEAIVPERVDQVIEIITQALFFYWFLIATRLALGADWLTSVVLLVVNWVPSILLSIIVGRYLGLFGAAAT
jgi:hypothetical protein